MSFAVLLTRESLSPEEEICVGCRSCSWGWPMFAHDKPVYPGRQKHPPRFCCRETGHSNDTEIYSLDYRYSRITLSASTLSPCVDALLLWVTQHCERRRFGVNEAAM